MPKMRTKQGENVYRTARNAGVLFTHELKNQEGAAELLEIERTRLARIELGQIQPRPEEVLKMADKYNAPELLNHYCRSCPIGKDLPLIEALPFEKVALKALAALHRADETKTMIINMGDLDIGCANKKDLLKILNRLKSIEKATLEFELFIKKNLKGCE